MASTDLAAVEQSDVVQRDSCIILHCDLWWQGAQMDAAFRPALALCT